MSRQATLVCYFGCIVFLKCSFILPQIELTAEEITAIDEAGAKGPPKRACPWTKKIGGVLLVVGAWFAVRHAWGCSMM